MKKSDDQLTELPVNHIEIDAGRLNAPVDWDDLPVVPVKNCVLFPGVTYPLRVMRQASLTVFRAAERLGMPIGIACQRDAGEEQPESLDRLYRYGVVIDVLKVLPLPDGTHTALVRSRIKFRVLGPGAGQKSVGGPYLAAKVKAVRDTGVRADDVEFPVMLDAIRTITGRVLKNMQADNTQIVGFDLDKSTDPFLFVNTVATFAPMAVDEKEAMLESVRLKVRASRLLTGLARIEQTAAISREIQERAMQSISENQRTHVLEQQMEEIRRELYGDTDDDVEFLRQRAEKTKFPPYVARTFDKELSKLRRLNPSNPEWSVQYNYLETLLDLPWNIYSDGNSDFAAGAEILDKEHYGLNKVKERILEQMAVMMNNPEGRSPIICLVGPPGVGKTSLGASVAKALGREYQRVSLGGLHDEAEIRGHRRTYIGAMPGRIISAMRRSKTANPVLLLDEVDKVGADYKGDPSAALLEVLDPEQNVRFHDNYIDVDFDLSKVLFIATANTVSTLSQPLLDRMEIINISGYLLEEKVEIARRHLIPRLLERHRLTADEFSVTDDALVALIEGYTAESGVRQLDKALATLVRKAILAKVSGKPFDSVIVPGRLKELLGVVKYSRDRYENSGFPGVVTGLAWTAVGGEILFIEASAIAGKGDRLTLTGNLGNVMKESATIALQYVRANAAALGLAQSACDGKDIHIHVPEGAIPKDGPSAGITMATAIASALTGRKVRPRIAMTGEITLRGKVLPVGGIKEKILAAKRAGITDIILSAENRKDIEEIPELYIAGLTFHYVTTVAEVIGLALDPQE